ncbi:MAG: hypothetical protein EA376_04090 [Phycisphaeraceae bacterium]|nr:MAG: hypothetical protein EA376_04090 [Phycisphaeraceae bacterium]
MPKPDRPPPAVKSIPTQSAPPIQPEKTPVEADASNEAGAADATEIVDQASIARTGSGPGKVRPVRERMARIEVFFSRLSSRNGFFQRLSSMLFLPYAFRSGIKMKRIDATTFTAVLPFKRFNRNWYNAMAGASLLANSEIAAGMYLFGETDGGYSVVCKELNYKFLRPCFGPAVYRVRPLADVKELVASGEEFTLDLELDIVQQINTKRGKERRVGRCNVTFYATPRSLRTMSKTKRRG